MKTTEKTALITGGGTGIGRAVAEKFIAHGYRVIVTGRRRAPLEDLQKKNEPERVLAVACDVSNPEDVASLADRVRANAAFASGLAVLVNNAGIFERKSFSDTSDDLWLRLFQTNLLGAARITRAFLPEMRRAKGAIINVASNLGLKPIAETSAYSALKAGMINWTQSLALELGSDGIRVNCVCPGIVDTPIHPFHTDTADVKARLGPLQPLGRIGRPEDIAHAIFSMAADGSEWMTGAVVTVDGGISLTQK